jgi:hypothetical protein
LSEEKTGITMREALMTRVRVNDPSLVEDLLDFLSRVPDCLAERIGEHEIEASIVSSLRVERLRAQLDDYLRAWEQQNPGARAHVAD